MRLASAFPWRPWSTGCGRPWPGASSRARPGGFEQLGWQVDLSRHVDGWVVAERLAAPVISVRAKLDAPGETAAR